MAFAITNYTQLAAAIPKWMDRVSETDLTDRVDDIIGLALARLDRDLTTLRYNRKQDTTLTATANSRAVATSGIGDFKAPRALYLTTFGNEYRLRFAVAGTEGRITGVGTPSSWTMNGDAIELDRLADQTHTFKFYYWAKIILTAASPTTGVLTDHPDVVLYACLSAAALFFLDPTSVAGYETIVGKLIKDVNKRSRSELGKAIAVNDAGVALNQGGRYDIQGDE